MARIDPKQLSLDAQKVMNVRQWAELNGVSIATAKRILASGTGPKVVQLSSKRIGIRVIDNALWQERNARTA